MGNVIHASPNQCAVVTSRGGDAAYHIGKCTCAVWCFHDVNWLNLQLMTMDVKSIGAETTKGVRVEVHSVAQVRVKAFGEDGSRDNHALKLAATHFLGEPQSAVEDALQRTMEGHQRQILGTLTVEEIYKDRAAFSSRLQELVNGDLEQMGYTLVSYTITSIDDQGGYMEALGTTQTALVLREAAEGKSRNESEARKKVAIYTAEARISEAESKRESHVATMAQQEQEEEANRDLAIKKAEFAMQVNKAKAEAQAAGLIEEARQNQQVVEAKAKQKSIEAQVEIEIAAREAERVQKMKEGTSLADLVEKENRAKAVKIAAEYEAQAAKIKAEAEAQAVKYAAEAEAIKVRSIGDAEAAAVRAKGEAEALVLQKKAEAFKQYGSAAVTQMVVEQLPKLAENVSKPLMKAQKMVFVSQDGRGGSMLTSDINRIISSLPETVEGLTGIDLRKIVADSVKGNEVVSM